MAKKRGDRPRTNYEIYKLLKLGHYRVLARLIAEGFDVSAPLRITGFPPESPLHVAAGWRQPKAVRVLLEAGADPNSREHFERRTPLMSTSCPLVAELLLESGADPRLVDGEGRTALDRANDKGWENLAAVIKRDIAAREAAELETACGEAVATIRTRRM